MHNCKACKDAKAILAKMDEMLLDGKHPTPAEMAEYNDVADFCDRLMARKSWKKYHRDVEGAIYPEDLKSTVFDAECAHNWVHGMYHKTTSGTNVSGEHWDMGTTTAALKGAGIDFTHITPEEGYIIMNMMWHDHYRSAVAADMENTPEFYIALALDMIDDDDAVVSVHDKLAIKYHMDMK